MARSPQMSRDSNSARLKLSEIKPAEQAVCLRFQTCLFLSVSPPFYPARTPMVDMQTGSLSCVSFAFCLLEASPQLLTLGRGTRSISQAASKGSMSVHWIYHVCRPTVFSLSHGKASLFLQAETITQLWPLFFDGLRLCTLPHASSHQMHMPSYLII